jgi:signal peptidase I
MMKSFLRFRLATLLMIIGLFAVCFAWYTNRVSGQPAQKIMHVGGSLAMAPTITREYLVVDINAYRNSKPQRWHAVVMNPKERPDGSTVAEVLRVVGLPGETVAFSDGNVIINGPAIEPPQRLQNIKFHGNLPYAQSAEHPYTIPNGHYYLLGDNPEEAKDSRVLGAYPKADIRGRVPSR